MLCEVRVAANKGLGLFAKRPIPRGTRILAEKPLVALRSGQRPSDILSYAKLLDSKSREQLLGLSWHPGGGIKRLGRWGEALGWTIRDRWVADQRIAWDEDIKSFAKAPGIFCQRLIERVKELEEAFRILSIFRSNSFNLASTATSPSTPTAPKDLKPRSTSSALHKGRRETDKLPTVSTSSSLPEYELALFPAIARINHSCIPNAQANYHPLHQTFNVHAIRDISADEEVSINYLPEHGQLRGERVSKLEEGYGFTCGCPACDLDTKAGQRGEQSRKEMQNDLKRARVDLANDAIPTGTTNAGYGADGMPDTIESSTDEGQWWIDALRNLPERERQLWLQDRELETLNSMLDLYEKEGIVGREVASMHYHIARTRLSRGDCAAAITHAQARLRLEEDCLGVDHPGYLEALDFVKTIRDTIDGSKVENGSIVASC